MSTGRRDIGTIDIRNIEKNLSTIYHVFIRYFHFAVTMVYNRIRQLKYYRSKSNIIRKIWPIDSKATIIAAKSHTY